MSTTLALIHTNDDGALPKAAFEVITAAQQVGGDLILGLIGGDTAAAAGALAGCGATRILSVSGEAFAVSRYASDAPAALAIVEAAQPDVVVAAGTARFARVLPGVAHRAGGRITTHVSGIQTDSGLRVERWYYRQRILAVLSRTGRPWFLLCDPGAFAPWRGDAGDASAEALEVAVPELRTQVVGVEEPETDVQTIRPEADLLLVAGAGWTKKQKDGETHIGRASELIQGFIGCAKASLGSSKSLVDLQSEGQETLNFMSHLNQVGQTGSTPRHPKGLATCCHGEEPHVVGWRFVPDRRAVNLNAGCGWAQGKADVLYVADAFEVVEKLNALLSE